MEHETTDPIITEWIAATRFKLGEHARNLAELFNDVERRCARQDHPVFGSRPDVEASIRDAHRNFVGFPRKGVTAAECEVLLTSFVDASIALLNVRLSFGAFIDSHPESEGSKRPDSVADECQESIYAANELFTLLVSTYDPDNQTGTLNQWPVYEPDFTRLNNVTHIGPSRSV